MKHISILSIFIFAHLISHNAKAQDIVVIKSGDTLSGEVKGVIQTRNGAAEWLSFVVENNEVPTRFPMSEVLSYRASGKWTTIQSIMQNNTQPEGKEALYNRKPKNYFARASVGFGVAGGLFLAGGGTLIISSILAENGGLATTAPIYVGYGLLFAGGVATVGGAIALSRGAKMKFKVGGVPVN